jgi:hypothetical protein
MNARPDAPIGSSSDDLLGRLPFVDEIVDLAITTPKEWAPRIGIYGSWGSGGPASIWSRSRWREPIPVSWHTAQDAAYVNRIRTEIPYQLYCGEPDTSPLRRRALHL